MITLEPPRGLPSDADAWAGVGLSRSGLSRFAGVARAAVGLRGEVEVLLAGDATLRRLNREFRGKDKATDVLSFPAASFATGHAGDLAISLETAARQATEFGIALRDEVRVLLLHGMLHLSGMDHEADTGEMAAREAELRRRLRLPVGLIARVEGVEGKQKLTPGAKAPSQRGGGRAKAEALACLEATATAKTTAKTRATAKASNAKGAKVWREGREVKQVWARRGVAA